MVTVEEAIDHIRVRPYMGSISRDKTRTKQTEEFFTPSWVVCRSLGLIEENDSGAFNDETKTFLDPCCGDGQFLGEILIKKLEAGQNFETALSTLYGIDIMKDNIDECRSRLLCGQEHLRHIVERNVICTNGLEYDYSFNGTNKTDEEAQFDSLFG